MGIREKRPGADARTQEQEMSTLLAWGRRLLVPLGLFLVVVALRAVGGGWYYYSRYLPAQRFSTEDAIQTTRVRRGSVILAGRGAILPHGRGKRG
jgi:hypothetical protein